MSSLHRTWRLGFIWPALALIAAGAAVSAPARADVCAAKSGRDAVALVELYTSEGCNSCPPADRWLTTTFRKGGEGAAAIPLAFHVDYWDRLGWKDRFASPDYTERQYVAMRANRAGFVYTPQVLVQGKDFPEWRGRGSTVLAMAHPTPARAVIALEAESERGSLAVKASARIAGAADRNGAALFIALADDGLASDVKAGENKGERLTHDHVVRLLRTAPAPDANGDVRWQVVLPLPAERGSGSTLVAFVQNARTGDVLQALSLPLVAACAPGY
jgi:hypothetical protein